MADGFGMVVSKDMKGYFTTPEREGSVSHHDIINALGWKDNDDPFLRNFVKVQARDWKIENFQWDEEGTLPGWAEESVEEIKAIVEKALTKCAPAWAEFILVYGPAFDEYNRAKDAAFAKYVNERDRYQLEARVYDGEGAKWTSEAYREVERQANEKVYIALEGVAALEYKLATQAAWQVFNKAYVPAWLVLHEKFSKIPGFVETERANNPLNHAYNTLHAKFAALEKTYGDPVSPPTGNRRKRRRAMKASLRGT